MKQSKRRVTNYSMIPQEEVSHSISLLEDEIESYIRRCSSVSTERLIEMSIEHLRSQTAEDYRIDLEYGYRVTVFMYYLHTSIPSKDSAFYSLIKDRINLLKLSHIL